MPRIGNEEIGMIDHIPICPNNGNLVGYTFHAWRVISAVKPIWYKNRALCWMVR